MNGIRSSEWSGWPSESQQMLLGVALCPDDEVVRRWQAWRDRVPFENIDYPSLQLVPEVYRRLKHLAPGEPLLPRMRGIYKKFWFANQLLLHTVMPALDDLDREGIAWMALKGVGMLQHYPGDAGLRPMHDFDILVREIDVERVISLLLADAWVPAPLRAAHVIQHVMPEHHAWSFTREQGSVDVHWHSLHQDLAPDFDSQLWRHAGEARLVNRKITVPDPTEHFLLTCVHGVRWESTTKLLWVVDAARLLQSAGERIDWDRLLATARRRRLTAFLKCAWEFLEHTLDMPMPGGVTRELAAVRPPLLERLELRASTRHPQTRALHQRLARDYLFYQRIVGPSNMPWRTLRAWAGGSSNGGTPARIILSLMLRPFGRFWVLKQKLGSLWPGLFLESAPPSIHVPAVPPDRLISFAGPGAGNALAVEGWSGSEPEFTWAERRQARLLLNLDDDDSDHVLSLLAGAYVPAGVKAVFVDVLANGLPLQRWEYSEANAAGVLRSVTIPAGVRRLRQPLDLVFHTSRLYSPALREGTADDRNLGLRLHWMRVHRQAPLRAGETIDFSADSECRSYLVSGWSDPEPEGVWSEGAQATLRLPLHSSVRGVLNLELTLTPFTPRGRVQRLSLRASGGAGGRWTLDRQEPTSLTTRIALGESADTPAMVLELDLPDAVSPYDVGLSDDQRKLGVLLSSIRITVVSSRGRLDEGNSTAV